MRKGKIFSALLAAVLVLVMAASALAVSYNKKYGQANGRLRVRNAASVSSSVIDNITNKGCVYITNTKVSGSYTFVMVRYLGSDGKTCTGWVCQSYAGTVYLTVLTDAQAKKIFGVSGGTLPTKRAGTYTASQRNSAASVSDKTSGSSYVRLGTTSSTVTAIQTKLKALGIFTGSITGYCGDKTVKAIITFQTKYGLTADGIAGPSTIAKINSVYAAKVSDATTDSSGVLKLNSTGSKVTQLQEDLTTLGYYKADITGKYGNKTMSAVKKFQNDHDLTADGIAGTKTLQAISNAVSASGSSSVDDDEDDDEDD